MADDSKINVEGKILLDIYTAASAAATYVQVKQKCKDYIKLLNDQVKQNAALLKQNRIKYGTTMNLLQDDNEDLINHLCGLFARIDYKSVRPVITFAGKGSHMTPMMYIYADDEGSKLCGSITFLRQEHKMFLCYESQKL